MQDELAVGSVLKRSYNVGSCPMDVRLQSLNTAVQCSIDTSSILLGTITLSGLPRNDMSCNDSVITWKKANSGPCLWGLSEGGDGRHAFASLGGFVCTFGFAFSL
jgi:hypothetical protein